MVNPTPLQLGDSGKPGNPSSLHMTKPETLAIMLQSAQCDMVFGAACKYLCDGLQCRVSYRARWHGPRFVWKKLKRSFIEFAFFTNKFSNCGTFQKSFSDEVCKTKS